MIILYVSLCIFANRFGAKRNNSDLNLPDYVPQATVRVSQRINPRQTIVTDASSQPGLSRLSDES